MKGPEFVLHFATGNREKYAEAARIASPFGIRLKHLKWNKFEIQSDRVQDIAAFSAKRASEESGYSVVCEDSGFFVQTLGGFPGPYSAYCYNTIGNGAILRLLQSKSNRTAHFQAVVAFCRPKSAPVCFSGKVYGTVRHTPKGTHGFGFDPIFTPLAAPDRTFAQMTRDEKNRFSHRAKAFSKCFEWLTR